MNPLTTRPRDRPPAPGRGRGRAGRRAAAVALAGVALGACTTTPHPSGPAVPASLADAVYGQPSPGGLSDLTALSCPTAARCWAVGTGPTGAAAVAATADGGRHWRVQQPGLPAPSTFSAVSCAGPRDCMAVGDTAQPALAGTVVVTTDGGTAWKATAAPAGAVSVVGVQCATAAGCVALATDGSAFWSATTTDGGQTWTRGGDLPAGFSGASGMDCPDARACLVAGFVPAAPGHGTGAVAVTGDGGATWTAASVPPGTGLLHAVSCTTRGQCLAVGTMSTVTSGVAPGAGVVLASTDGGATFVARSAPSALDDGFAVSCPAATTCAAVGTRWTHAIPATPLAGVATTGDLGATFRGPAAFYVPGTLVAVDCPDATGCVAAGDNVLARFTLPPPRRSAAQGGHQ